MTLGGEGIHDQLSIPEKGNPSTCILFVVLGGVNGQLNDSEFGTDHGEDSPACSLVVYYGRGVNAWSTQQ